jgi:hypothetical protein
MARTAAWQAWMVALVTVLLAAVVFPDWQESNVVLPVCEDPGKRR